LIVFDIRVNAGEILDGYSSRQISDDMSYYDGRPHVIVDDQYYVEPSRADVFWQSPPSDLSAVPQVHNDARY